MKDQEWGGRLNVPQAVCVATGGTIAIFFMWLLMLWAIMVMFTPAAQGQVLAAVPATIPDTVPATVAGEVERGDGRGQRETPSEMAEEGKKLEQLEFEKRLASFSVSYGLFLYKYCGSELSGCKPQYGVFNRDRWEDSRKAAMKLFGLVEPKGGK
jgi:hypothetical protein